MRQVPPAHSPVTFRGLLRGAAAAVGLEGAEVLRGEVEALLRGRFSPRELVLLDSGTSALALALSAAAAGRPGAPVALPAYSCYDLATAAVGAGVEVVLYDLDPATLGPDPASLRRALGAGPCAVVAAPLYGIPVDMKAVMGPARDAGALPVVDAAQGIGAEAGGRPVGSAGSLAVLSFGRGKGLTGGGGGALLAHDDAGVEALDALPRRSGSGAIGGSDTGPDREAPPGDGPGAGGRGGLPSGRRGWRELGQAAAQWVLARPALYGIPASLPFLGLGETEYREPWPPAGPGAASLGVLAGSWARSWEEAEVRRARARGLLDAWRPESGLAPVRVPGGAVAGYLRLPFVAEPDRRPWLGGRQARRLGIMPGYPRPLAELDALARRLVDPRSGSKAGRWPGAETLAARLVTFPIHSRVGEADLRRLGEVVGADVS